MYRILEITTNLLEWFKNESLVANAFKQLYIGWFLPILAEHKSFNILGLVTLYPLIVLVWFGIITVIFMLISGVIIFIGTYVILSYMIVLLVNKFISKEEPKVYTGPRYQPITKPNNK